jgi:predicted acyltransferase
MLPTAANVILGALAGELLMTSLAEARKILILAAAGTSAIASGLALQHWIPVIKKIRTLPYSVDSMGITILVFLLFYWIGDVRKQRRWAKVFQIVGSNSIFIYLFSQIMSGWLCRTGLVFTGWAVGLWGPFGQVLNDWLAISFEIYLCWWLYRRKIFFKL